LALEIGPDTLQAKADKYAELAQDFNTLDALLDTDKAKAVEWMRLKNIRIRFRAQIAEGIRNSTSSEKWLRKKIRAWKPQCTLRR